MAEFPPNVRRHACFVLINLLTLIQACSWTPRAESHKQTAGHTVLQPPHGQRTGDEASHPSTNREWPDVERNILTWDPGPIADAEGLTRQGANIAHVWPYPRTGMNACLPPAVVREGLASGWQDQINELHRRGLKVIVSTSSVGFIDDIFTTAGLKPADFYGESPEGGPGVMLGGNFGKNVHVSCLNNPDWLKLHCELADLYSAAGADGIWYDVGCYADRAVLFCQCAHCQAKWREHLTQTGLPKDWPLYRPKTASEGETSGDMTDPIKRAHLHWRWQCWEEFWGTVIRNTKAKYPAVRFGHNMGVAETAPGPRCVFMHATTDLYDFVHWEETSHSAPPWSILCSYLLGRAAGHGKPVVIIQNDDPRRNELQHKIWMAEGYAAGGVPQTSLKFFDNTTRAIFDLIRREPALFQPLDSIAQTAIVYSSWSAAIEEVPRGAYSAYWMGQLLIDGHVPFDYLVAETDLNLKNLARYHTLVLPDVVVLSDSEMVVLRQYLEQGGRIVVTGNTAGRNDDLTPRANALARLGLNLPPERLIVLAGTPEKDWWDAHPRNLKTSLTLNSSREKLNLVIAAVCGKAPGSNTFEVIQAAPTTAILPWRQGNDLLVHLVNYNLYPDASKLTPDHNITCCWRLPPGLQVRSVSVHSPYQTKTENLVQWTQTAGLLRVSLTRLEDYLILRIATETTHMQQEGVTP